MKRFRFNAVKPNGESIQGYILADSRSAVQQQLEKKKYGRIAVKREFEFKLLQFKLSDTVVARFTRQLAVMVESGLPLAQGLEILGRQNENKRLKMITLAVLDEVKSGKPFSIALRLHAPEFGELYSNMVRAGENAAAMGPILNRLAQYYEKSGDVKRKVKSALMYPAIVVCVAIIAVLVLATYVVPSFAKMFEEAGKELPAITTIIINASGLLKAYFIQALLCILVLIICFRAALRTEKGRFFADKTMLKTPYMGVLLKRTAVGRFSRNLSTLLKGGVPLVDALEICAGSSGNKLLEKMVREGIKEVSQGKPLHETLEKAGLFPDMAVQMIAVGERVGELSPMLEKVADIYDSEVSVAVDGLVSIVEPVMMVLLGVVIGVILIAMYMPMFNMMMILE